MCWEAQLTEAVRLRPQSAEAWNALGEAFDGSADSKMARGAFEKAIAPEPAFAQAQVNPGRNLVEAGEFGAAAKPLDRALKILGAVPDAAFPNYLRAKISIEQNDAQQAAVHLEKAVSASARFCRSLVGPGTSTKDTPRRHRRADRLHESGSCRT
jgi:Tfp pilus assembly protein PilF